MEDYKRIIIERINTKYQGLGNTKEYKNIIKNIDNITKIAYKLSKYISDSEDEDKMIWDVIKEFEEDD